MNKIGYDRFSIRQLAEAATRTELNELEAKFIREYDCISPKGYNLKSGGDASEHAAETKALLKVKNAENMRTTFVQFRKHKELDDLPIHCIYLEKRGGSGVAINKHPLCEHKEFMVKKHGTMEAAKTALREFLQELEASGKPYVRPKKKGEKLPKGVRAIRNCYFVDKTINGKNYQKYCSGKTKEENKQEALAFLEQIIQENS